MTANKSFAQRRQQLCAQLGPNSIAIIAAAPEVFRNADSTYYYRQHSDFFYLTGLNEPDAVAFFIPGGDTGEFIVFNRPRDPSREQWEGSRLGQEGAREVLGADAAFPIAELSQRAPQLLQNCTRVFYLITQQAQVHQWIQHWLHQLKAHPRAGHVAPSACYDLADVLHEQRLIKQPEEIELLRRAADVSAQAHSRAMQACRPNMHEYELEAEILYDLYRHGCRAPAYSSIVAGGVNACTLHYVDNRAVLQDGTLVLIDAGGEYQHYAADITRTFPVGKDFSREQQAIYEIVLAAQTAAIDAVKPGIRTQALQDITIRVITQGLIDLKLIKEKLDSAIEKKAYHDFYMHHVSHWLGMDVHDVGAYKQQGQWRKLEAGMTLTIEPGIYIAPHLNVDPKWQGIGVRIEDDVLVTQIGHDVLSAAAPKHIADIRAIRQGGA